MLFWLLLSLVGSYALNNNFFDVIVALVLGIVGFIMTKADFPMAPAVLGLVLGARFESEFRRALQISNNSLIIFWQRPIAMGLILAAVVLMVMSVVMHRRSMSRVAAGEEE